MNALTESTLRRWVDVLKDAPEVRLLKVLEARELIRAGLCDLESVLDRAVDGLACILR